MALTDPIADMLTIIRNGSNSKKEAVEVKNSRFSEAIIKILKEEGFISAYKVMKDSRQGMLRIHLRYAKDGTPAISGIKRISKSGLRVYAKANEIPAVYGGIGISIVSTSKGIMTDAKARENKVGGEVICHVW